MSASPERGDNALQPDLTHASWVGEAILDWIPARIFSFLFALGGHFVEVFACWRKYVLLGLSGNAMILSECGTVGADHESQDKNMTDCVAEKKAISLLDRVFIIVLVIVAIIELLS